MTLRWSEVPLVQVDEVGGGAGVEAHGGKLVAQSYSHSSNITSFSQRTHNNAASRQRRWVGRTRVNGDPMEQPSGGC